MKQFIFSLNMTSKMNSLMKLDKHIDLASKLYNDVEKDIKVRAKNLEFAPYKVGDKIGQMVFGFYPTVKLNLVEELSSTDRGEGGFGSTGK